MYRHMTQITIWKKGPQEKQGDQSCSKLGNLLKTNNLEDTNTHRQTSAHVNKHRYKEPTNIERDKSAYKGQKTSTI